MNFRCLPSLAALALATAAHAATAPSDIKGYAPVSVSAANYQATPREQLVAAIEHGKTVTNPELSQLKPAAAPQRFVFMQGEQFEPGVEYARICDLLTPALAQKGFVNAVDVLGRIYHPEDVKLILRVTFGTRPWRLPTVRTKDLTWYDGMVAHPHGATGLHMLGGDTAWDERAGGNDDVFAAMAANNSASAFKFGNGGGGGGSGRDATPATGSANASNGNTADDYAGTRDFHLIVVDAFDAQDVKAHGRDAKRLWSTFVAAPVQDNKVKFADVMPTLIRNATPYFGETTSGLQVYSDARAEVKIGEMVEVKDDAAKK